MDKDTRTLVNLGAIVAGTIICGVLAYFLVSEIAGSDLTNASNSMQIERWKEKFSKLVIATGVVTGICSLTWFGLARWWFKINSSSDVGRRKIWASLAIVALIFSVAVPQFYSSVIEIKINSLVLIIFAISFTGLGYWLLSILTTPSAFKYTPPGASFIRDGRW